MPYKRNHPAQLTFVARDNVTGQPTAGRTLSAARVLSAQSASAVIGTLVSVGGGRWRFSANSADMNAEHVAFTFVEQSTVPVCMNIRTQGSTEMLTAADISAAVDTALDNLNLQNLSANMETRFTNVSAAVVAVSAAISAHAKQAITDYDPPTAAEITALSANLRSNMLTSAGVSAQVNTVLVNRQVPSSAAVSAIVEAIAGGGVGLTSAQASTIMAGVLTDYDVASSADVSAIVAAGGGGGGLTSAGASAVMQTVLTNYQVPSSAAVSGIVEAIAGGGVGLTSSQASGIVAQALTDYDAPTAAEIATLSANLHSNMLTSAGVSAVVDTALDNLNVATSAGVSAIVGGIVLTSAGVSSVVQAALTNYDVASSADVSAILAAGGGGGLTSAGVSSVVQTALTNYDVPTSADVSAILAAGGATGVTSAAVSSIMEGVLPSHFLNFYRNVEGGVAVSATAGGIQLRASAASAATHLKNFIYIYDTSGSSETEKYATGKGQMRFITAYSTSDKWVAVNSNWDILPQAAKYLIIPAQAASAGSLTSSETSAIVQTALVNRQVVTSAGLRAELSAQAITSARASAIVKQALGDFGVATSAHLATLSAEISGHVGTALDNKQVATSAQVAGVSAAVAGVSAAISARVATAITNAQVLTSASQPVKANLVTMKGGSAAVDTLFNSLAVVVETSVSGTLATVTDIQTELTSADVPDDDWLVGRILTFRGGALDGQQTEITGVTSAGTLTVTTCTRAPANGQAMIIT